MRSPIVFILLDLPKRRTVLDNHGRQEAIILQTFLLCFSCLPYRRIKLTSVTAGYQLLTADYPYGLSAANDLSISSKLLRYLLLP